MKEGEDLSWFWRGWYLNNWNLDLAVTSVHYIDGDPEKGARVEIANLDKMVMPTVLEILYPDGATERIALPVETWILGSRKSITVRRRGAIASVSIDPDHALPDKDRRNNFALPTTP